MGDRLILERIHRRQGLIILTDADKERRFKVIAIGPKVTFSVKEGDIVFLPGVASEEPDYEFGSRILVRQEDLGVKESN